MSVYTDIYNNGVTAYNTGTQDKAAADAAIPGFYSTINNWSPMPPVTGTNEQQQAAYMTWFMGLEASYQMVTSQALVHYQRLAIDVSSLQIIAMQAQNAINQDRVYPNTLTDEESANLSSGISSINSLISQIQSTQSSLNSVQSAANSKYNQLMASAPQLT